jgi:hypothetical protein
MSLRASFANGRTTDRRDILSMNFRAGGASTCGRMRWVLLEAVRETLAGATYLPVMGNLPCLKSRFGGEIYARYCAR